MLLSFRSGGVPELVPAVERFPAFWLPAAVATGIVIYHTHLPQSLNRSAFCTETSLLPGTPPCGFDDKKQGCNPLSRSHVAGGQRPTATGLPMWIGRK